MNKVIVTFPLLTGIVVPSCTASKSVISQKADLSRYECASIISNDTYHTPVQLMEYEVRPFDAIESSRPRLVNDICIGELSPNQQSKLFVVKYGVDILEEEPVVTVNSIDYLTGRLVASCRGAYTILGFSASADIRDVIKRVAKQIAETFLK